MSKLQDCLLGKDMVLVIRFIKLANKNRLNPPLLGG